MLTIAGGIVIAVVALAFLPELLLSTGVLVLAAVALLSAVLLYSGIAENWSDVWPVLLWFAGVFAVAQLSLVYVEPEVTDEKSQADVTRERCWLIFIGALLITIALNISTYSGVSVFGLAGWFYLRRRGYFEGNGPAEKLGRGVGEFFAWMFVICGYFAIGVLSVGGIAALFTGSPEAAIPMLIFGLPGLFAIFAGENTKGT